MQAKVLILNTLDPNLDPYLSRSDNPTQIPDHTFKSLNLNPGIEASFQKPTSLGPGPALIFPWSNMDLFFFL